MSVEKTVKSKNVVAKREDGTYAVYSDGEMVKTLTKKLNSVIDRSGASVIDAYMALTHLIMSVEHGGLEDNTREKFLDRMGRLWDHFEKQTKDAGFKAVLKENEK